MSETLNIHVPIQVEHHLDQLVRARPLGPWDIQVVGSAWEDVEKRLSRQLSKALPSILPSDLFAGGLPAECESWKTPVELPPQQYSAQWQLPLQVELDSFRWRLSHGNCVVRIPAVNCVLFGKHEELDNASVAKQAKVALIRMAENRDLLSLSQRFSQRVYSYRSIRIDFPIGGSPERSDKDSLERKATSTLRAAASDLSKAALGPIYGLDEKAAELADYFRSDAPQSVLLVGPAGVGKTSLVYQLVKLSRQLGLEQRRFWSTSGARIVSGMSGLGMWQERCSKLIRQAHATRAILHLGSLFELMEAGKIDGQPGVASMVKQSIAAGKLLAIAECTPEQLAVVEREDPILLRAFTQMELKEHSSSKIREILGSASKTSFAMQNVGFSEQAIEELYRLHTRFATYSAMPATALRLMRTITDQAAEGTLVESDRVARAFAEQTGLPQFLVDDSIPLDLASVSSQLAEQVIGQSEPIELIVNLIATLKARMVRPGRPLATLMFIGPTGVGKTEMAKAIARLLYSDTSRMLRIDMSEYSSPWSAVKLIGKPGEGDGTLTSPIREQPFSVILLDEFEKADANVFDILLQVLGEGRLTDSHGRLADFRNAVVIMTSNLGAESFRDGGFGFGDGELPNWKQHFEREVRSFVRPEFLGRLDRIVAFRPLSKEVVKQIAIRELDKLRERPGLKYSDASIAFSDEAIDLMCNLGYQPKYGARPLRRAIERNVVIPLANALSEINPDSTWGFEVLAKAGEIVVQTQKRSTKTKSDKDLESEAINAWQQLGMMARTAQTSSPVRDLENELERTLRQNEVLEKRLLKAEGPSRVATIRSQLQQAQAFVEVSRKIRSRLFTVVDRICNSHLTLMTNWHRGQKIEWEAWQRLNQSEMTELRQAIEDIVRRRISSGDVVSIIVVGRCDVPLDTLWKSYRSLAAEHSWGFEGCLLSEYDARRDADSAEFRKRVSERKVAGDDANHRQPLFRMSAAQEKTGDLPEILADAFATVGDDLVKSTIPSVRGFAIQFRGLGVESWLEAEAGVVHFYDPSATGGKRRMRYRVMVFSGQLQKVVLPLDWQELSAAGERDPRRIIDVGTQTIANDVGQTVAYAHGKQVEGIVDAIRQEHELALWQSIGYSGIPSRARLNQAEFEFDIPF